MDPIWFYSLLSNIPLPSSRIGWRWSSWLLWLLERWSFHFFLLYHSQLFTWNWFRHSHRSRRSTLRCSHGSKRILQSIHSDQISKLFAHFEGILTRWWSIFCLSGIHHDHRFECLASGNGVHDVRQAWKCIVTYVEVHKWKFREHFRLEREWSSCTFVLPDSWVRCWMRGDELISEGSCAVQRDLRIRDQICRDRYRLDEYFSLLSTEPISFVPHCTVHFLSSWMLCTGIWEEDERCTFSWREIFFPLRSSRERLVGSTTMINLAINLMRVSGSSVGKHGFSSRNRFWRVTHTFLTWKKVNSISKGDWIHFLSCQKSMWFFPRWRQSILTPRKKFLTFIFVNPLISSTTESISFILFFLTSNPSNTLNDLIFDPSNVFSSFPANESWVNRG